MSLKNQSQEALATLGIEQTSDHILVLDSDLCIRYVNRLLEGLTWEATIGSHATTFLPPEAREMVESELQSVLDTGQPTRYESAFSNPNGNTQYFESRAALLQTPDGERGVVICTSDTSSQKEELFDLEHFFDLTDDLMAVVDHKGRFLRVNRAFQEQIGYGTEEVYGKNHLDFIHPDDREAVEHAISAELPTDQVTFRGMKPDGTYIVLDLKVTKTPDTNRSILVGRDVTQARSMERQLLMSQKMEAIGRLAGGIAHDFNNLLTSMLVNTQLALDDMAPDDEARELLDSVIHAGNLSADLTKQLLAMSRRDEAVRTEVDLNRVVTRLLAMLRRTISETIDIDFIPGHLLPMVRADGAQLEQVLLNLSLNARDAMVGGGRLTITTDTVRINGEYTKAHPWASPGRYVLLQVSDTGVGIPPELQERIFEPFFTTKEVGQGTGLGLTIAYKVVQQHDGMMHVYSELGRGTTFKVYLPVSVADATSIQGSPAGQVPAGREHVLLAEDEPLVRAVVERVLRRAGYSVTSTTNGAQALALIDAGRSFDLLLMDVVMPEMGGADVVRVLHGRGASIPIVLASGYSHGTLSSEEFRDIPLLQKPFDPDALLRVVRERLDSKS
jgi:PAS domain S-box-containing protein